MPDHRPQGAKKNGTFVPSYVRTNEEDTSTYTLIGKFRTFVLFRRKNNQLK
jgi:hypothetical protein